MADLTENTTRKEWLTHLAESYAKSAPYGGNTGILAHMVKVHSMPDSVFEDHKAGLLAKQRDPLRGGEIQRMALELPWLRTEDERHA